MKRLLAAIGLLLSLELGVYAEPSLHVTPTANRITQPGQTIGFELDDPGHEAATTHIFNLQGDEVAGLTAQSLGHFSWDGTDVNRQPVESGMYVVQIHHHGQVWHGPVLVNR